MTPHAIPGASTLHRSPPPQVGARGGGQHAPDSGDTRHAMRQQAIADARVTALWALHGPSPRSDVGRFLVEMSVQATGQGG